MGAEELGEGANAGGDNPFLQACNDMFKEYEKVTKEGGAGGTNAGLGGLGAGFLGGDDELAKLLSSFTGDMLNGDSGNADGAMENIMNSL